MTADCPTTGLSTFDRAQLEKDRLERQRKRASEQRKAETWASESPHANSITDVPGTSGLGAPHSPVSTLEYTPSADSPADSTELNDTQSTEPSRVLYWKHHQSHLSANRAAPGLDLSSLVTPTIALSSSEDPAPSDSSMNLTLAIVSAPVVDAAWLMQYISPENVSAILVAALSKPENLVSYDSAFSSEAALKFLGNNWLQCRPEVGGSGLMRANYMLLFYGTSILRVVITSADFTEFDWTAVDNVIWVQDFPARPETISTPMPTLGKRFASTLSDVMHWQDIPAALLSLSSVGAARSPSSHTIASLLECYDFSTVEVALVASIPGKHDGWPAVQKLGHTGLMSAVNDINRKCPLGCTLDIEYLTPSLAPCTPQWLRQFQNSAGGGDGHQSFLKMSSKSRQRLPFPDNSSFKIIFPSRATTGSSDVAAPDNARAIPYLSLPGFPGHLLFNARTKFCDFSMCSKVAQMIIAIIRNKRSISSLRASTTSHTEAKYGGWYYLGSHDLTIAAWGEWLPTSTWFTPSLKISHCALGVVIPLHAENIQSAANTVACFQRPAFSYSQTDVP